MRAHLETLKRLTEAEGRDFSALTISYKAPLYDTGIPDRDGTRRSFSGKPDDIAGDIRTFAAIGVHELIFDFRGESIAESIERLQRFAAEVMPLVGDALVAQQLIAGGAVSPRSGAAASSAAVVASATAWVRRPP